MRNSRKPPQKGLPAAAPPPQQETAAEAPASAGLMFGAGDKEVRKPHQQLELTDAELMEEVPRMLTANNPNAAENLIMFNVKEKTFKSVAIIEQSILAYQQDGWIIHHASDDARRQGEMEKMVAMAKAEYDRMLRESKQQAAEHAIAAESSEGGDGAPPPPPPAAKPAVEADDTKELRNQFKYSERAAQTSNNPLRERETMTEPPPVVSVDGYCSLSLIYDSYLEDQERQRKMAELTSKQKKPGAPKVLVGNPDAAVDDMPSKDGAGAKETGPIHSKNMALATYLMERMVNQNMYSDIADDYRYWEDLTDQYRPGEGTLLPLWKFFDDRVKKKTVTSLCWNARYSDLFAVGYGSFDYQRQGSGAVCCFSLKNPSHPECYFQTESGVMALDFHPVFASLLAVGLYDGSVLVYDVAKKQNMPLYQSTARTGKHTDPVWQVRWHVDDMAKTLQLFSVSSDGRVTLWTMSKNEVTYQDAMELRMVQGGGAEEAGKVEAEAEAATVGTLAGGCCLDFNRHADHLFLVGTEEGLIHKCSKAYNSQYLETYRGHTMPVYSVKWNAVHPQVFCSAGADWSVKIWEHTSTRPFLTFDLNHPVEDIAWAPFSSTVFVAVTSDGKVHVFDLNQNKHEPMCEQKVVRKARLTKVAFSPRQPVILVGDDKGCVTSLKLSPNLRQVSKSEDPKANIADMEIAKLNKIIEIQRKAETSMGL